MSAATDRSANWLRQLDQLQRRVERVAPPPVEGVLTRTIAQLPGDRTLRSA